MVAGWLRETVTLVEDVTVADPATAVPTAAELTIAIVSARQKSDGIREARVAVCKASDYGQVDPPDARGHAPMRLLP